MTKRILVDAANPEEVRVAVVSDHTIEEFEVETAKKSQLRGNIYVAEIMRVEPSLQAAFVNYGAERNGFLAFSEIHPKWYDLPEAEKTELLKELEELGEKNRKKREEDIKREQERLEAREKAKKERDEAVAAKDGSDKENNSEDNSENHHDKKSAEEIAHGVHAELAATDEEDDDLSEEEREEDAKALAIANSLYEEFADEDSIPVECEEQSKSKNSKVKRPTRASNKKNAKNENDDEYISSEEDLDSEEEKHEYKKPIYRRYDIANVIKTGAKILIQVVKEERGTKGAALTTYISLPGRFTVLMPNTPYAGGVSRKISDHKERRALKQISNALEIPKGVGVIIRTAGVGQNEEAITNDMKNLLNHWDRVQESFEKAKPSDCLYEEGNVVLRSIRDMLSDDIEEIHISGHRQYELARNYMESLMPESAKILSEYKKTIPLFSHYGVEQELLHLHRTRVQLPSGGYLVINPTEALVSIDINSGRSTQEKNIEETALKTNLEAAEEIARQLRLRDLAGLIVIDFIDMEDRRNERAIERAMRKAIRQDRARIQIAGISMFGLLEMSRQRMRPSYVESTFVPCKECNGSGMTPSTAAAALIVLRHLEEEDVAGKADKVILSTCTELAIYMLNHKKELIRQLEARHKYQIIIQADDSHKMPDFQLELVNVKANGAERTRIIEVALREEAEIPPEKRMRKRRRNKAAKNAEKNSANNADDNNKRHASEKGKEDDNKESSNNRNEKKHQKPEEGKGKKTTRGRRPRRANNKDEAADKGNNNVENVKQPSPEKKVEEKVVNITPEKPKEAPKKKVAKGVIVETIDTNGTKVSSTDKKQKNALQRWWSK